MSLEAKLDVLATQLEAVIKQLQVANKVVLCPDTPIIIPGITAADALDAADCMGTPFKVAVPRWGILYSATYWDLDDEGTQVDLEIFSTSITTIGNDSAWAPTDTDLLKFITELAFVSFDDHINNQTSELTNIGKAYVAPEGYFTIQAVNRSAQTIAAGSMPRVQFQILSLDPAWVGN